MEAARFALACQCLDDGFRTAGDHGEVGARRAVGASTALFPILQGSGVESKAAGKFGTAKPRGGANGANIHIERKREVVHGCRLYLALGNFGSLAHGFNEFVSYIFAFHELALRTFAADLIVAAKLATSRICSDVRSVCSFLP